MENKSEISDIPPWKKHLIARLRASKTCCNNGNSAMVTVGTENNGSTAVKQQMLSVASNPPTFKDNPSTKIPSVPPTSSGGRTPKSATIQSDSSNSSCELTEERIRGTRANSVENALESCGKNKKNSVKMVQENLDYTSCESVDTMASDNNFICDYYDTNSTQSNSTSSSNSSSSGSSEELHYGPGIVSKLKNKYLSLTLRHEDYTSKQRPSILSLRKATSLENLLESDTKNDHHRRFAKNSTTGPNNRYCCRSTKRGCHENSVKQRARSVETISRRIEPAATKTTVRPKSFHSTNDDDDKTDEILIKSNENNDLIKGSDGKTAANVRKTQNTVNDKNKTNCESYVRSVNRPKRIAPIMNEREKPPADVVKQAKRIFEKRPETRTKPPITTGEVAAKVATYKNIIIQSKPVVSKKPTVINKKPQPPIAAADIKKIAPIPPKVPRRKVLQKPKIVEEIKLQPDVSIIKSSGDLNGLCQTPDLILTTSPLAKSTPDDVLINFGSFRNLNLNSNSSVSDVGDVVNAKLEHSAAFNNKSSTNNEIVPFNEFIINDNDNQSHRRIIDENNEAPSLNNCDDRDGSECRKPPPTPPPNPPNLPNFPNQPSVVVTSPPPQLFRDVEKERVNEKNLKNTSKNAEKIENSVKAPPTASLPPVIKVKKTAPPPPLRENESNSIVFKFTDRKDVPDYVQNDKTRIAAKLERPKVGEGGIILLSDPILQQWLAEEEEEIKSCLEAPPSPCNVSFINDNILIDGKSSINHKTKKNRMRISFVESTPDIYEYPSESSFLSSEDYQSSSNTDSSPLLSHTVVPMLSGSSLANYTPKSTEEFQPGVSRTNVPIQVEISEVSEDAEEIEQPINFSEGTNSDMLF